MTLGNGFKTLNIDNKVSWNIQKHIFIILKSKFEPFLDGQKIFPEEVLFTRSPRRLEKCHQLGSYRISVTEEVSHCEMSPLKLVASMNMYLNKQTGYGDMKMNLKRMWKLLHTCHGGGVPLRDVSVETRGTIEHRTQQTYWIWGYENQSQTYVINLREADEQW